MPKAARISDNVDHSETDMLTMLSTANSGKKVLSGILGKSISPMGILGVASRSLDFFTSGNLYKPCDPGRRVFIEGKLAATVGDIGNCGKISMWLPHNRPQAVAKGSSSVYIGGKGAARLGDPLDACKPFITGSAASVYIGD